LEILESYVPLPVLPSLGQFVSPVPDANLELDHVYVVNLKRRSERRRRMELSLKELGIQAEFITAVDGR